MKNDEAFKDFNTVLSHGNEQIMKNGLWFGGWTDANESDMPFTAEDIDGMDCSPQYGGDNINLSYEKQNNRAWALTMAPRIEDVRGDKKRKADGREWLSEDQLRYIDTLQYVCFGDEEGFSKKQTGIYASWIEDFRTRHPDVLLHYNHYYRQTTFGQLQYMLREAKPDIITYDEYFFSEKPQFEDYKTGYYIVKHLNRIRKAAMLGLDGTGCSPIPFGQYLLGYKTGTRPCDTGKYEITESQLRDTVSLTLLMGGKWLTIFRLAKCGVFIYFNEDGSRSDFYYIYKDIGEEIRTLSEHLKYLQTSDIEVLTGRHKTLRGTAVNPTSAGIKRFAGNDVIKDIKAESLSENNDGLPADVFIGYFDVLPADVPAEFGNRKYFAVCNSMAQGNGLFKEEQKGSSEQNRQKITLTVNEGRTLCSVEKDGSIKEYGKKESHNFILGGGMMKLFFIK